MAETLEINIGEASLDVTIQFKIPPENRLEAEEDMAKYLKAFKEAYGVEVSFANMKYIPNE